MAWSTVASVRLVRASARYARGWFTVAVLATVLAAAASLAVPSVLASALDTVVRGEPVPGPLMALALVLAVAVFAGAARLVAGGVGTAAATGWLRRELVRAALSAAPFGSPRHSAGELTNRLGANCAETGRAGLAVIDLVVAAATSLGGVTALFLIDWRVAVTFLLGLPPTVLIIRRFVRVGSPVFARYQEVQGSLSARLLEALGGARTIRASGTLEVEANRVLTPLPQLTAVGHQTWWLSRQTAWQFALLLSTLETLVLAVAGYDLFTRRISTGELTATVGYVAIATAFFDQIDRLAGLAAAATAATRVAEVLDQPRPVYGDRRLPDRRSPNQAAGCRVTVRDATVRIAGRPVLRGVNVDIPAGSSVAVVGRSGAGKSHFAALVGRLCEPDSGVVLLDGIPTTELAADVLPTAVAYAFARPALLGETVRDTIALGAPTAAATAIESSARSARADDFIRRLPQQYHTGLSAAPMSGGEAQRLGLARALAQDSRVIVIDDAMSSLDTATEAQVSRVLSTALTDRTRIIITHRASTAARADLVVWLVSGRLRAAAPHAHLWLDPRYRALFAAAIDSATDEVTDEATDVGEEDSWMSTP